ncbi:MAG: sigma-70 family RNA polymerase sigma factor [Candidatus Pacearchaeota archaeon]|nr:sigma-70 family RNA polymerase sigma factor [Candidatus Pacearchaeota archaeon]
MFPLEEIAEKIAGAVEKSVEFLFPDKLREVVARLREERNVGRLTSVEDRAGETYTSEGNEFRVPNVIGYNGWQGIEGNTFRTPVEVAEKGEIEERINGVLGILDPREREILKLRFGIHYGRSYTLEEVGKVLEVSRERIRQIEVKAMWRLRHPENGGRILEELSL